jgi:hypothetical protein
MENEKSTFNREAPSWPTDPGALKRLERHIEFEEIGDLSRPVSWPGGRPRYLVTYMNSQTRDRIRSATVVSVTNRSNLVNRVFVFWYKGFSNDDKPVGSCAFAIPPDYTVDFCSRHLPGEITTCNCVSNPELTFDEGRAIVSSMWPEIGVSGRVYYTADEDDGELLAITDSKIVKYDGGTEGD